jgi:hypothetical protein
MTQQEFTRRAAIPIAICFLMVQIVLTFATPSFAGQKLYHCFVFSLVGLVAGCAGWACGLFLSPMGTQVQGAQKVVAAVAVFWSGVVVGHLKDLSGLLRAWEQTPIAAPTKIRLLFGLGVFLFALCVTFNTHFEVSGK